MIILKFLGIQPNPKTSPYFNFRDGKMSSGHQVVGHFRVDFQVHYQNKTQLEHLLKIQKILFRYLLIPLHSNHRLLIFERLFNKISSFYKGVKNKFTLITAIIGFQYYKNKIFQKREK